MISSWPEDTKQVFVFPVVINIIILGYITNIFLQYANTGDEYNHLELFWAPWKVSNNQPNEATASWLNDSFQITRQMMNVNGQWVSS